MAALIPSASATGSGTMTLAGPSTNSNQTVTIPDATGTMMVSGNMPAFSAYAGTTTTLTAAADVKVIIDTELFDTANCFSSSRFTPNVAGYYQVNACMNVNYWNGIILTCGIWKNGSPYRNGNTGYPQTTGGVRVTVSDLVYLNGTTDYIELYGFNYAATSNNVVTASQYGTYFTAFLARSA